MLLLLVAVLLGMFMFLFHAVFSVLFWCYYSQLMVLFVCCCFCSMLFLCCSDITVSGWWSCLCVHAYVSLLFWYYRSWLILCVHAYGSVLFWYYCSWLVILFVCPCLCFYTVLIFLFLIDDPLYALAFLPINIMFIYWYSHFILLYLCWSGGAVQHLGCFKEKVNRYELQPELMAGELLELSNSMTVDQCANRWELAFDRLDPKA